MGDELTQPVSPAALLRARFLKAALKRGTPPTLLHTISRGEDVPTTRLEDTPDIQRAHLERLVENAPEAMTVLDADLRVIRINAEFTRMFGYTAEEAIGRTIQELIVPEGHLHETREIAETLGRTDRVSLETKRRHKDGTLVDVSILGTALCADGKPIICYGIYSDISEQKRAAALNSALYRIAEKASSAEDLQQFYRSVHSIVGELMYARTFYIALFDPDRQLITFLYFQDEDDAPPPGRN